ncbi:MAG: hypothetical protein DRJ40_03575 [Thermoprotei archaeon]|nr:MAG: hypothetical protein DRJ40_03575 [Thermoprotei archaeon]
MVKVRWHGHACFEISTPEVTVVIDPHDGISLGIKKPEVKADIVLISHDHFDHNKDAVVAKPGAEILKMFRGEKEVRGVRIKGIETAHDDVGGRERGKNIVYVITVGEVTFCHLGDLGHILTEDQVREIGAIDVLMIPVGGTYTIGPEEAKSIVKQLNPKVVIPMHYKIPGLQLPLLPVSHFLKYFEKVKKIDSNEIEITRETLPAETTIYVLSPP